MALTLAAGLLLSSGDVDLPGFGSDPGDDVGLNDSGIAGWFGGAPIWFSVLFVLVAGLIALVFLTLVVRGLTQWVSNNRSPLVCVPAVVVAKRAEVSRSSSTTPGAATMNPADGSIGLGAVSSSSSTSTSHWVTFEVQGGERVQLPMTGQQYGLLVEGDRGMLTHQGTRFKGFDRTPQDR